ncbi:FlgD immunoglobulin-like domain containing protein [Streptomyces sp. NPDC126499]|uniref:FlgD immunoglobulin-like domain containing protein n=1 Tax=Streptomyces sp. NPDC126499 TaxID=3155314 RepID=UPI003318F190
MVSTGGRRRTKTLAAVAVAVAAALLSAVPAGPFGSGEARAADVPAEVVFPAEFSADPDAGVLPAAGTTGFVQGRTKPHWVSFADGARTSLPAASGQIRPTGSDVLAVYQGSQVLFQDPKSGARSVVSIPQNRHYLGTMGLGVITRTRTAPYDTFLRYLDGGVVRDRPLSGLPAGAYLGRVIGWSGEHGLLATYGANGAGSMGWVDASFTVRPLPPNPSGDGWQHWKDGVLADQFLLYPTGQKLQVWDVTGDWSGPTAELLWSGGTPVAFLGDQVLARVPGEGAEALAALVARSLGDGGERPVLDRVVGDTPVSADGSTVVVARQGEGTERSLHAVRVPEGGGAPVATRIGEIPPVRTAVRSIALGQGVLYSTEVVAGIRARVRSADLPVDAGSSATARKVDLGVDDHLAEGACWVGGECEPGVPTGDGRVVYSEAGTRDRLFVLGADKKLPAEALPGVELAYPPSASGRYVAYHTIQQPGNTGVVYDLDTQRIVLRRPDTGRVAIDGGTLWAASSKADARVTAVDVRTGAVVRTVQLTTASCFLSMLHVRGSFLHWSCGDGHNRLRDLRTGKDIALPANQFAWLGDGYLAYALNGVVSAFALDGTGRTRVLGTTKKTYTVTVDRFGGHVAFADDEDRIHVVPTGFAAPALTTLDTDTAEVLDRADLSASWTGRWWLSKPAASWTLTVKDRTGAVVSTSAGGEVRGLVKAGWDGKDENGKNLADGGYTWALTAVPADGSGTGLRRVGEVFLTHGGFGTYEPVTPARLLDTRSGLGAAKAKVGPGGTVTLQVAGRGGVASGGVSAVVLNVTATNPSATTFVSAYPYGTQRTDASNLNVAAGQTVSNLVTVPVKDGKVTLYNRAGTVDLVADVAGYYTLSGEGDRFLPVEPARILDTRAGLGAPKAKVGAARTVNVRVTGRGGVPATGVSAVVLNLTATNPSAATFVSVYPYGTLRTAASNLNVSAGRTAANAVVVPVKDGQITLYNHAGMVDLLADMSGYFTTDAAQGARFQPVTPARVMDTRQGLGGHKLGPAQGVALPVAGTGGVPATGASAVVLNVTATNATAPTYLAATTSAGTPTVSNINLLPGGTVPNLVVVPVTGGRIYLYNHAGSTDVIVDVFGYYTNTN